VAVADVFEAMNSHRPYRPALCLEGALDELTHHSGTQYDAAAVAALVRLIKEKNYQPPQ
jgi:HD-GYP domain-containing protein (c-di-GMP phosphodiesterase class II)